MIQKLFHHLSRRQVHRVPTPLVFVGSGSFSREVLWLVKDINASRRTPVFEPSCFLTDGTVSPNEKLCGLSVLKIDDFLKNYKTKERISAVIAVGNPGQKKSFYERFGSHFDWPVLVHPSVTIGERNVIGQGSIVAAGTILTVDIDIQDFVTINLNCTVGHDVSIGKFSTVSPGSNINGNVVVEESCEIGSNVVINPKKTVGRNSVVGAGSVVVKSVPERAVFAGNPSKLIRHF